MSSHADGHHVPCGVLRRQDAPNIAFRYTQGKQPTVVFFPGYASDMQGIKARALSAHCAEVGYGFLRFDYSGHGASAGSLHEGTIGSWRADALAIIGAVTRGRLVFVGSSMGAWIMILVALSMRARVHAVIGIAAAADFTEDILWARMSDSERNALQRDGVIELASRYSERPFRFTSEFIEEARAHLILRTAIELRCPVHLFHGRRDKDVPWETSMQILDRIESRCVNLTLVKDGEHRLSEPGELAQIIAALDRVLESDS